MQHSETRVRGRVRQAACRRTRAVAEASAHNRLRHNLLHFGRHGCRIFLLAAVAY